MSETPDETIRRLRAEVVYLRDVGNLLARVIRSGPRRAELEALKEWEDTCRAIFAPSGKGVDSLPRR